MKAIYFDANATTKMLPGILGAYVSAAEAGPANPSSAHSLGAVGRDVLYECRSEIARALQAHDLSKDGSYVDPDDVFLTSGGTEGNNIVISGFAARRGNIVGCSSVEHASVLEAVRAHGGFEIGVDAAGMIDVPSLKATLDRLSGEKVLFCLQAANSETGVIQNVDLVARICQARGVHLLVDAAQAFGRTNIPVDLVQALTFSGHKLHGPQGTGALLLTEDLREEIAPTVFGGGQEHGVRPGTQNVPGIAGLAAAVRARFADLSLYRAHVGELRSAFEKAVVAAIPSAKVVCGDVERLPNTSNIMFPGADAMAMLARLDGEGIICSNGSACSSMKPSASHVLLAMGIPEKEAFSCLRFSFSMLNTMDEVERAVPVVASVYETVKAFNDR